MSRSFLMVLPKEMRSAMAPAASTCSISTTEAVSKQEPRRGQEIAAPPGPGWPSRHRTRACRAAPWRRRRSCRARRRGRRRGTGPSSDEAVAEEVDEYGRSWRHPSGTGIAKRKRGDRRSRQVPRAGWRRWRQADARCDRPPPVEPRASDRDAIRCCAATALHAASVGTSHRLEREDPDPHTRQERQASSVAGLWRADRDEKARSVVALSRVPRGAGFAGSPPAAGRCSRFDGDGTF